MFVLKKDGNRKPFAIVIDGSNLESFKTAISEEHSLISVKISKVTLPDWGNVDYFSYSGEDENGTKLRGVIQITKLVAY